jgi:hypothetical protein
MWVVIMAAMVLFVATDDPTKGHAGRLVYSDESAFDTQPATTWQRGPSGRVFRLAKTDRVVRMTELSTRSPQRAWIRIASGPHAGRSGVIIW